MESIDKIMFPKKANLPYAGITLDDAAYMVAVLGLALYVAGWWMHIIGGKKD